MARMPVTIASKLAHSPSTGKLLANIERPMPNMSSAASTTSRLDCVLQACPGTPSPEILIAVFGDHGVASALRPPQLLIDFSTIKVAQCKPHARRLRETTAAGWIDAPVSGGPPASGSGTLTVMSGGEPAEIERARVSPPRCSTS